MFAIKHMSSSTEVSGTFEGYRPSQREGRHVNPLFTQKQSGFLLQLSFFARTVKG